MTLTRDEFLKKTERRFLTVELPSGGEMRLRSLKRSEIRQWRRSWINSKGNVDARKLEYSDDCLLAMTLVDADGNPLFTVKEAQDGVFDDLDGADSAMLIDETIELNKLGRRQEQKAEAALKNSEETRGNDSSGDSSGGPD